MLSTPLHHGKEIHRRRPGNVGGVVLQQNVEHLLQTNKKRRKYDDDRGKVKAFFHEKRGESKKLRRGLQLADSNLDTRRAHEEGTRRQGWR